MNAEGGREDDDFAATILPEEVDELAVPIPLTTLEPWHRPRKQFIRERQWRSCADRLVQRLVSREAPSIRSGKLSYLTLPGVDYFDVEVLGEMAIEHGLSLEASGLLAEFGREPVKARSQFRSDTLVKRGVIVDTSVTYPYRFEDLASRNSQAYREVRRRAPFHIINVDACGSVALPNAKNGTRIIDAVLGVMSLQFETMRDPWLLYLTTDVRIDNLSLDIRRAVDEAITVNAAESEEFRVGAIECIDASAQELGQALAIADRRPEAFVTKFGLGFSKWLLHNAQQQGWNVRCCSFFCYSTTPLGNNDVSMPCLAFEFQPTTPVVEDVYGAARIHDSVNTEDTEYSMTALRRAAEMRNVDELLAGDDRLRREFTAKQRRLLQKAGYRTEALVNYDVQYSG